MRTPYEIFTLHHDVMGSFDIQEDERGKPWFKLDDVCRAFDMDVHDSIEKMLAYKGGENIKRIGDDLFVRL